jgi:uncharacterized protein (TIGR04255 family)
MGASPEFLPERPSAATRRRYGRPPILEAIIDIQAELPPKVTIATLGRVYSGEETAYPVREEMIQIEGTLNWQVGESSGAATQTPIGYRFVTQQRDKIVQVRMNGMSSSRLHPYTSWEENRDEAKRLWEKFLAVARPSVVTRIGVRYINRIRLPESAGDLTEYFRVRPELPSDMPHSVNNFVLRLEIPQPDLPRGMLILNEGMVPDPESGGVAFLLDLDVFQALQMPPDSDDLWSRIELLHERENTLFEQSVTDRTRALFS